MAQPAGSAADLPPVELTPPEIACWREAGGPAPFVATFTAAAPGPHVAITAVVHGNEPAGAIALDWLLRRGVRPVRGRLSLAFVNPAAYARFDPDDPTASRWVDEDLNRLWDAATLASARRSVELARARALRPWVETVDLLLDLHSMQGVSPPLTLAGVHDKGVRLAVATGVPALIVSDAGHAAGRRLRDYGAFGQASGPRAAILVECGQHWARRTGGFAVETAVRFLRATGAVPAVWAADVVDDTPTPPQRRIAVSEAVTVRSKAFRFVAAFHDLQTVAKAGTVIAEDGGRRVTTPYDDCVLIMPSRRLWPGQTAVRLGRYVD